MATMLDLIKARQQGIFGLTPQQLESQRQQEQRKTIAQQIQQFAPRSPTPALTSLGIAIGSGLGQGLLSRFGGEDLQMQQAQQAEQNYKMLEEQVRASEASKLASQARIAAFRGRLNQATTEEEFNRLALIASSTPELVDMVKPILNITERMFPEQKDVDIEYERIGTINIGTEDNPIYRQGVYSTKLGYGGYIGEDGKLVRVSPDKLTQETAFDTASITNPVEYEIEINGEKRLVDTFFDKNERKQMYFDEDGNVQPVPMGARVHRTSLETKQIPSIGEFERFEKNLNESKNAIRSLSNYLTSREGARQGFGLLADQFITMFKTLVDSGKLSEEEFNAAVAQGQFEGLIGQVRVETVGGGVMTEQDAKRIMKRLGGFGALSNKEVVAEQIKSILVSKAESYQRNASFYNYSLRVNEEFQEDFPFEDVDAFNEKYLKSVLEFEPTPDPEQTNQTGQRDWAAEGYVKMRNNITGEERWVNETTGDMQPVEGN
jgi:hypothetical protein